MKQVHDRCERWILESYREGGGGGGGGHKESNNNKINNNKKTTKYIIKTAAKMHLKEKQGEVR